MIECPIPQDILKYKAKVVAGFALREAVCLTIGTICGVLAFFNFAKYVDNITLKAGIIAIFAMPAFIVGFVKPLGQPFEKIAIAVIIDNFITPPKLLKEIRHPELEKYERTRQWMLTEEFQEGNAEGGKKTSAKKKSSSKKNTEIKIKPSKTYKAIR